MRINNLILALVLLSGTVTSQNLLERSSQNLTCQSSESPNLIAQDLLKIEKSDQVENYQLFRITKSYSSSKQEVGLRINARERARLVKNQSDYVNIAIPLTAEAEISMELRRVQLFADDFQWQLSSGEILKDDSASGVVYRGIVNGDQGSVVSMSIYNNDINILISDIDGNYRMNTGLSKSKDDYVLFIEPETRILPNQCGNGEEHSVGARIDLDQESTQQNKSAGDIVQIYFECDKALYDRLGGAGGVQTYLNTLFAEIATLYANEGIIVQMSSPLIWNTNDPYISTNSVGALLENFGNYRKNNYTGRLAALLSGRTLNGQYTGGIAWVDVLCATYGQWGGNSGPYSINYNVGKYNINPYPSYSLEVSIITHELGHNMGSHHTQDCYWGPNSNQSIDACVSADQRYRTCANPRLVQSPTPPAELGTIMSYCNNINFTKGFGTEPGARIYNRYVSASCLVSGGGGGGSNSNDCTHTNRTFNGGTIDGGTEVRAGNNINFQNSVSVSSGGAVMLSAENSFNIYGSLTIPQGAEVEMNQDDCN